MYKYAQLNENFTVEGISYLSGYVFEPYMLQLDDSIPGDSEVDVGWRFVNGHWEPPFAAEGSE